MYPYVMTFTEKKNAEDCRLELIFLSLRRPTYYIPLWRFIPLYEAQSITLNIFKIFNPFLSQIPSLLTDLENAPLDELHHQATQLRRQKVPLAERPAAGDESEVLLLPVSPPPPSRVLAAASLSPGLVLDVMWMMGLVVEVEVEVLVRVSFSICVIHPLVHVSYIFLCHSFMMRYGNR